MDMTSNCVSMDMGEKIFDLFYRRNRGVSCVKQGYCARKSCSRSYPRVWLRAGTLENLLKNSPEINHGNFLEFSWKFLGNSWNSQKIIGKWPDNDQTDIHGFHGFWSLDIHVHGYWTGGHGYPSACPCTSLVLRFRFFLKKPKWSDLENLGFRFFLHLFEK